MFYTVTLQRENEMGFFSAIKKAFSGKEVIFEGASESDRELFNQIVRQVAEIYKTGQQREMFLKLKFEYHITAGKTESGETVYRILGNRSFSKDSLYDAYKDGVINAVRAYTP